MAISTLRRRRHSAVAVLFLSTVLSSTACGRQRVTGPSTTGSAGPPSSPGASAASPHAEPGAGDGAPHYRENNGFRLPGEMSSAGAKRAQKEAERIEPVLKRLWEAGTWEPKSVRAALLKLGHQEERSGPGGERRGGTLTVRAMDPRFETDHYVRPEGALIGLRVRSDACVTAFVQKSNYQVKTNGPFPETGCFEPRPGHGRTHERSGRRAPAGGRRRRTRSRPAVPVRCRDRVGASRPRVRGRRGRCRGPAVSLSVCRSVSCRAVGAA